jgi:predicted DNA binding protein
MDETARRAPLGVLELTAESEVRSANPVASDLFDATPQDLVGEPVTGVLPRSATGALREALAADPPTEPVEEYYPEIERWLRTDVATTDSGTVLYVRDRTALHDRDQRVERLEQRMERLERIDSLVAAVFGTVVDASTREEVWQTVCERLGGTELYEFAWVGERDPAADRLDVAASGGDAPTLLDEVDDELGDDETLERRAVETGSTQLAQSLADEEWLPRSLRVAAFGRGLQSALAVPLVYDDTVYGVLGVYAAREGGFSDQEVASLETLGSVAGFAVNAIMQADLLFADTVTELTVSVRDTSIPFTEASEAFDGPLELDGVVARNDGTVVSYLRGRGETDDVVATLETHQQVTGARVVEGDDETALLEVTVTGGTPTAALTNWGATVTDATYTGESADIVATVPPDGDVREAVEVVDRRFAETALRSKERRTNDPDTTERFRDDLAERLTDRQRTVLRTAHLADYFTSPRSSTSEEVAEALDISGPTVLYHLRNAQRKLLDAFFDEEPPPPDDR